MLLATIVVTGTGDTIADDGIVTLREAITAANTNAASGDATAGDPGLDTIAFSIPGDGVQTIHPLTALPTISDSVIIDGYTQPGTSANTNAPDQGTNAVLRVELNLDLPIGLWIAADNSVVRGLVIHGSPNSNILVGSFPGSIGGPSGGAGTVIEGNFIGTNAAGTDAGTAGPVAGGGVTVQADDVLIGGTAPAARNLISGVGAGISIGASYPGSVPTNVRVQGNLIGTNAAGTAGINQSTTSSTGTTGVFILGYGGSHLIGGSTPAARNIISGFDVGVRIGDQDIYGAFGVEGNNRLQGNYIGLDITGTAAIPNGIGVLADDQQPNSLIGGIGAGEGNVISGNRQANVDLTTGAEVQGNLIGPNAAGDGPPTGLPADFKFAAGIDVGGDNNTIGGTEAGAGNVIAYNLGQGVFVDGISIENAAILGNSIFSNGALGIDLLGHDGPGGVNENNRGPFNVANEGQNYPVITGVSGNVVSGTFHSDASKAYRIEFFAGATVDPTGFGEGQTFLGFANVTTDPAGDATFSAPVAAPPAGQSVISATATGSSGTSEFAADFSTSVAASADLGVTVAGSPDPVAPGGTVTYAVTVSNGGPDAARDVTLNVPIPAGTTFLSSSTASGWTIDAPAIGSSGGTITATSSMLAAAAPVAFTFVVSVDGGAADGSTISAGASVASATTGDPDDANNTGGTTTTVHVAAPARADVGVTVSAAPDPVAPGATLTYTITATDDGPDAASGVGLLDDIPAGTTFVSFTNPDGWSQSTPAAGGTGSVSATSDALSGGAVAVFTLIVRVDPLAADGATIVDSAAISTGRSTDPDPDNDTDTTMTTVAAGAPPPATADLEVTQSASAGTAIVGMDDVTFTVTVTNRGPASASAAMVTEALPAGAAFVSATGGATPTEGTLTLRLGDLANGASRTFTIVVRPGSAGTLTASATASATQDDPSTANNTAMAAATAADPAATAVTPTPTPAVSTDGPRIVAVRRYGIHTMPTAVVVTFDGPLGVASVRNVENYRITDRDGSRVAIRSAVYDATAHTVTLRASRRISIHHPYKLVIRGTGAGGISDAQSRMLDGQGTGRPGSDYTTSLTWRNLILPAWYRPAKTSTSRGH